MCSTAMIVASSLFAADAKEEIAAAAKKLDEQANYTWTTTVAVPEGTPFSPGPTEGKVEKDGTMHVKSTRGDTTTEIIKKGDKTAFTNMDGQWQSLAEAEGQEGGGRFMGAMVRNVQTPVQQATNIIAGVKEFKKDGDALVGDLTEDAAKSLLQFRGGRRGGGAGGGAGGGGPTISDAKGSAKFWIKDGVIAKFEFKVSGKMDFNGNQMDQDRTTTVEIKDVGKTKVEVPEAAKAKLS